MAKTLLEAAKAVKLSIRSHSQITDQHIDLALAWLKDEIRLGQVSAAIKGKTSNSTKALVMMTYALRLAYRTGKITIKQDD